MTLDIEKAFDSVNLLFFITALEKYGVKEDFGKWIQILIQSQESLLLMEGKHQIISSLKELPIQAIQFQHIYLYLF